MGTSAPKASKDGTASTADVGHVPVTPIWPKPLQYNQKMDCE
jgi:hypothetical protein